MGIIQRNTDPLWLFDGEQLPVADLTAKLVQKSQDRHREIFRDSWSNTPAHLETWSVGLFGTEKKAKRREGRPFLIHLKPNHVSRLHLFGESAKHGTVPRVNTQELLLAHTLDKNPNRGGGRSFDYKHRRGFKEYLTNNSLWHFTLGTFLGDYKQNQTVLLFKSWCFMGSKLTKDYIILLSLNTPAPPGTWPGWRGQLDSLFFVKIQFFHWISLMPNTLVYLPFFISSSGHKLQFSLHST